MPIPEFTRTGDLPVGVHQATLDEVIRRFGAGNTRKRLSLRLEWIFRIASETGFLRHFIVFGSFVTSEVNPNDVDVFMIMDDNFEYDRTEDETSLLFNHQAAESHFGCSVFWTRTMGAIGGEQAAIEDWQIKRDGTFRGIIEIIGAT